MNEVNLCHSQVAGPKRRHLATERERGMQAKLLSGTQTSEDTKQQQ